MRPGQAISSGLRRTFVFSGRAGRLEYWWFFPFGLAIAVLGWFVPLPAVEGDLSFWNRAVVLVIFSCPLMSATWRRLQDTGEDGAVAMRPLMPFLWLTAVFWLIHFAFAATLGGIPNLFVAILFFAFWIWILAGAVIAALWIGPLIGQLLLPSQPGPNKYGPNPL